MSDLEQPWPLGLGRRNWPFWLIGFVLLIALLLPLDAPLSRWAQALPQPVRAVFGVITHYGLSDWVLIPTLVAALLLFVMTRVWRPGLVRRALGELGQISAFVFVGVGLPGLVTAIAKRLLGRGRPELLDTMGPWSFQRLFNDHTYQSFPSGHTTTAFALALTIGFLERRLLWPLLLIAAAVGVSRVVVGAHFPTDVVGGAVAGTVLAYAVRNFFAARHWLFRLRPDGTVRLRRFAALRRLYRGYGTPAR